MDNWLLMEDLVLPEADGSDEEIVCGDNVAQVEASAMETLAEVVDEGNEEILPVEEEQRDALYRELLTYKRRLSKLEQRVAALEARLKD